ncbi:hypothetical protein K8S17_06575 [bacterium]|nr:hypothetical protein [bacterium]
MITVLAPGVSAGAESDLTTPTAPPEGELSFDIPLYPRLVREIVEFKMQFVRGVASSAVEVASEYGMDNAEAVVMAAGELSAVANRISGSVEVISAYDPTFGIDGLSQMMPAQGATRDTLFGLVIWHETVAGNSRQIATDLERVIRALGDLGNRSLRMGRDIGHGTAPIDDGSGVDYTVVAENTAGVMNAIAELELVAADAESAAVELEGIVWSIRDGRGVTKGSRIDEEWENVQSATSAVRRLASRIVPAVGTLQGSNHTFVGLMHAVDGMSRHMETIESLPVDGRGMQHLPWESMRTDVEIVEPLKIDVLDPAEGVYPEEELEKIRVLLRPVVEANRLLAERAVEYATTQVAGYEDRIDAAYRSTAGYDGAASDRDRQSALEQVDGLLRANLELQAALTSARAAREWYDDGVAKQMSGYCSENKALIAYKNVWLHALNAGAAAQRAAQTAGVK